jgi:indolepyruvate ferredoxin oxidoreductase alpha subunit
MLKKIVQDCDKILVLEEGYPIVEEMLRGYLDESGKICGRMDNTIPFDGELNPDKVAMALEIKTSQFYTVPPVVVNRPPMFCKGCCHADLYNALNESLAEYSKGRVFSDIGCYTLGAMAPYDSINSCVDMGASITMAKGASDAGLQPSVSVIGDSTFTHSGMTGLLDVVVEQTPVTIIISDNSATAMTGGQQSAATGRLYDICKGIGVDPKHIIIMNPLQKHHDENVRIIKEELAYQGVSVIISQRECIQSLKKQKKESKQV